MPSPKFKAGQSGNPAGRPKGKPLKVTELRATIDLRAQDILQAVINAAILGDMTACKMLLDRITPTLKPQAMPINLVFQESLALQGNEIIKATVDGQIAPDIGAGLINALAAQAKIIEADDVIRRLEILEAAAK
jgi:hypothetical protein